MKDLFGNEIEPEETKPDKKEKPAAIKPPEKDNPTLLPTRPYVIEKESPTRTWIHNL